MQPKVNILFIEGEQNILTFVTKLLYGHNYKVTTAITGTEGLQLINSICPDLILLDLGLPDMDGQTIIRQVREWSDCPIIVISARTNEHEKVKALDLGADDYITKPFGSAELLARIRTSLRHSTRMNTSSDQLFHPYKCGELILDFEKRTLTISGNIYNEEFTDFQKALEDPADPSEKAGEETVDKRTTVEKANTAEEMAEEFILQHHSSYVSLYLLDKYFVQKETPDFSKIKKLVEVMTGVLQDKPYIERLNETITQAEKSEIGKYAPFFSLPNAKGEKITRSSDAFKQKSLLINFWASWNDSISQKQSNSELREIYKKYKKNKYIGMLGISLDVDKQQWKDAIKRDTLDWEQVCDFGGLNSEVAKQYSIYKIPANILLSSDGKILAKNLRGEELKKKIENIVEEATEKEKKNKQKK